MSDKKSIKCQNCGHDFKTEKKENICIPCQQDLEEMEAHHSQQFFMNMPFNEEFFNLHIDEKRAICGINDY